MHSEELSAEDESEEVSEEWSDDDEDDGDAPPTSNSSSPGSETIDTWRNSGRSVASLPTDVLHSFCRIVQLGAYTTKAMYAHAEILRRYGPDFPEELIGPRPTLDVVPLRLCCKELETAYDFVRPSIRFAMEQISTVGSYLRKLPNLVTVAIDCDERCSRVSPCLRHLHGIVPGLQRLGIRHKQSDSKTGRKQDFAYVHVSCLLPWHLTLRHLELRNMLCFDGDVQHPTDRTQKSKGQHSCDNLGFLSGLVSLQSLHVDNTFPVVSSADLACCSALETLYLRMPEKDRHTYHYPDESMDLELELPACRLLRELHLECCELTALDVTTCPLLEAIDISDNKVAELDLSNNPLLKKLSATSNNLKRLDLTGCPALEKLHVANNPLTDLLVTGCTALKELRVAGTDLEVLDLTGCSGLENYGIDYYPPLSKIILAGCTSLEELYLTNIKLLSLDLTGLTGLKKLVCKLTKLTVLTVAGCTSLASLDVNAPVLGGLDLSNCTALRSVLLEGCLTLTTVNLAGCTSLILFDCKQCAVQTLDLTSCRALRELHCGENSVRNLDVSPCPLLAKLVCGLNPLETLCTTGCEKLVSVNCSRCAQDRPGKKGPKAGLQPTPEAIQVVEIRCPLEEGTCASLF